MSAASFEKLDTLLCTPSAKILPLVSLLYTQWKLSIRIQVSGIVATQNTIASYGLDSVECGPASMVNDKGGLRLRRGKLGE